MLFPQYPVIACASQVSCKCDNLVYFSSLTNTGTNCCNDALQVLNAFQEAWSLHMTSTIRNNR